MATLNGTPANDTLTGTPEADTITGGLGDDVINGGDGDDLLLPFADDDIVVGGAGFDILSFELDWMFAAFVDMTTGTYLDGFQDVDTVSEVEGLIGTGFHDRFTGDGNANLLSGLAGNDRLTAGGGNDTLLGGEGDDTLDAGSGADSVDGGPGTDVLALPNGRESYTLVDLGGGSFRVLDAQHGIDVTATQVENLRFGVTVQSAADIFAAAAQTLVGTDGADTLFGSEQGDRLEGRGGPDRLVGYGGDDLLISGSTGTGDADDLVGGPGNDTLDGTGGLAAASYRTSPLPVNIDLASGSGSDGFGTTDTFIAIAGLEGSVYDDTLRGDAGLNYFVGNAGNDVFDGRDGFDWASYDNLQQPLVVDLVLGTASNVDAGNDTLTNIEGVSGGSGNDTLIGSAVANHLRGNAGADLLQGGDGDDSIEGGTGNDTLEGGAGSDWVLYTEATGAVSVQLAAGTAGGAAGTDSLSGFEHVRASPYNDTLFGDAGHNWIEGGAGLDQLNGRAGNDTLDGGVVLDRVFYNDNTRLTYLGDPAGIHADLSGITGDGSAGSGVVHDGHGGTDVVMNITTVIGTAHADSILGSAAFTFEVLDGGDGNDTLDGGAISAAPYFIGIGNNRVMFSQLSASVVVDLAAGTASGHGSDLLSRFNQVRATPLADTLRGSDASDWAEQFDAGGGNDSIDGRGGFDLLRFDSATTGVVASLVSGTAQDGLGGTDTFTGIEGLRGGSHADSLIGGLAANGTTALGRVASDGLERFIGMGGADTIAGGQGFDRAEYVFVNTGIVLQFNDNDTGTVLDGTGSTDALLGIEAVVGSLHADALTGSARAYEWYAGLDGADTIAGGGGIDEISFLHDELQGAVVNLGAGTAVDGWGDADVISGIEWVEGTWAYGDTLTGDTGANRLDGVGGNDSLAGAAGDDTLLAGTGDDTVDGGDGSDVLVLPGTRAAYLAETVAGGALRLSSLVPGERVTFTAVETLRFADGDVSSAALIANQNPRLRSGADPTLRTTEDTPLTFTAAQFLAAFEDPDGDALAVDFSEFGVGTVTDLGGGQLQLVPPANYAGSSFGFVTVTDSRGGSLPLQVAFEVTPVNDAPVQSEVFAGAVALTGDGLASSVVIQPGGRVVVALTDSPGSPGTSMALQAVTADGRIDTSFGTAGRATFDTAGPALSEARVAVGSDGRLVVAGVADLSGSATLVVAAFGAAGQRDLAFAGGSGMRQIDLGLGELLREVRVDDQGRIVIASWARTGSATTTYETTVVRLLADGTPDASFGGGDGIAQLALSPSDDRVDCLVTRPDGSLLLGGRLRTGSVTEFAVTRLMPDGSLDTAFAGDGTVTLLPAGFTSGSVRALLPLADGSIVLAGFLSTPSFGNTIALARLRADGSLDTTWGTGGWVLPTLPDGGHGPMSLLAQGDGVLMVGQYSTVDDTDLLLLRLDATGAPVSGFGTEGLLRIDDLGVGWRSVIDAEGRLLVPVSMALDNDAGGAAGVVAVRPDGTLDPAYNPEPVVETRDAGVAFTVTAAELLRGWIDREDDLPLSVASLGTNRGTVQDLGDGSYRITPPTGESGELVLSFDVVDAQGARTAAQRSFALQLREQTGGTGTDTLLGSSGVDVLNGVDGDDVLDGAAGSDRLDGGPGLDIARWTGTTPVTVDLRSGTATQGADTDTLINIEAVFGSDGPDTFRGADGLATRRGDTIRGGGGNDSLDGGTGVDTAEWLGPRSDYVVTQVNATTWTVRDTNLANGDEGTDTVTNIERFVFADQMLSFGTRAEDIARVAIVLWSPAIMGSTTLFSRGYSFYDVGYSYAQMSQVALQFWGEVGDEALAAQLVANSGTSKTAAQLLATLAANGGAGSTSGRAAMVREAADDPATLAKLEQTGVKVTGIVSDHFVPDFGTLFGLLPG